MSPAEWRAAADINRAFIDHPPMVFGLSKRVKMRRRRGMAGDVGLQCLSRPEGDCGTPDRRSRCHGSCHRGKPSCPRIALTMIGRLHRRCVNCALPPHDSPMSPTPSRRDALRAFAAQQLGDDQVQPQPASADASFRGYWRVHSAGRSYVLMDAPPDKEDIAPWLDVGRRLRVAGLNAPKVLATDLDAGFVLMDDMGERQYLPELNAHTVDALYGDALGALLRMQVGVDTDGLPDYDHRRLVDEMELMPTWFVQRHLGIKPECEDWDVIESMFGTLTRSALLQPRRFVHRDFHSRNLMLVPGANPGIIDFQDAVRGPLTYDLVSLLRDCYIAWPREQVLDWAESHRLHLRAAGATDADAATWKRWFDLMGMQRHLKVLGIFCRLCYRDGKAGYLNDLPLVLRYTLDVADEYAEMHEFGDWLRRVVGARDLTIAA